MSEMTLAAHEWKNTDWAQQKDFMQSTAGPSGVRLIYLFTSKLASYNPEP
jgi:methylglutaconyl-CoA hydratase